MRTPGRGMRILIFLCCVTALCYGLFRKAPPPELFEQSDKLQHLVAFATVAFTGRWAFPRIPNEVFWTLALPLAPLLEWLQHQVQPVTRTFSLEDAAANLAGILLAGLVWRWLQRREMTAATPG